MTNDLSVTGEQSSQVERIERFHTLQAGHYWRSKEDIASEGIAADTVLLISSLKYVEGLVHTVCMRPHPDLYGKSVRLTLKGDDGVAEERLYYYGNDHRFLVANFLELFEYEPNAVAIRAKELLAVQGKVTKLQEDLEEAQTNPLYLQNHIQEELAKKNAKNNPDTEADRKALTLSNNTPHILPPETKVGHLLKNGITEQGLADVRGQAEHSHAVASIQAKWIAGKTDEIAKVISSMTPYYSEKAAAAIASTEDVRNGVDRILRGVETLDLYVVKGVEWSHIRKGRSAASSEPVTIMQQKLAIDEELSIWADVDAKFDVNSTDSFYEALCEHDDLVNQIFPTTRCIVVMATTRRFIDYGNLYQNMAMDAANKRVAIYLRDGENIYAIHSPVESHLGTARLFPSKTEHDNVFRGWDGSEVTFDDVAYTENLEAHEKLVLHYKRFLILLCGLDHREKLLGDFYDGPANFDFMTQAFQDRYFRFIHDDEEGSQLDHDRESFAQWIERMNGYLSSGSRVLCIWDDLLDTSTAPGAFRSPIDEPYLAYTPMRPLETYIVRREKQDLIIKVPMHDRDHSYLESYREFNCRVNLSRVSASRFAYLVLDAVDPDELEYFIHSRKARKNFLAYIKLFKRALKHVREESVLEWDMRTALGNRLVSAESESQINAITDDVVRAWRTKNRGRTLPTVGDKDFEKTLMVLEAQAQRLGGDKKKDVEAAAAFAKSVGLAPLRLSVSGSGDHVLYLAPGANERDDRFLPYSWVHQVVLSKTRNGFFERYRSWKRLMSQVGSETPIHEWPKAEDWLDLNADFARPREKEKHIAAVENGVGFLKELSSSRQSALIRAWMMKREELNRDSEYVQECDLIIPVGLYRDPYSGVNFVWLCMDAVTGMKQIAHSDRYLSWLQEEFCSIYARQEVALERFDKMGAPRITLEHGICPPARFDDGFQIVSKKNPSHAMPGGQIYNAPAIDFWLLNSLLRSRGSSTNVVWYPEAITQKLGQPAVAETFGIEENSKEWTVARLEMPADALRRGFLRSPDLKTGETWVDVYPASQGIKPSPDTPNETFEHLALTKEMAMDWAFDRVISHQRLARSGVSFISPEEAGLPPAPEGYTRSYLSVQKGS